MKTKKPWTTRIWLYICPLWEGRNKKISLRRVLAISFSIDFISNFQYAVRKWSEGRSMDGLSSTLMIEGALIAAMLGLTSYYNYMERKNESVAPLDKEEKGIPPE